MDVDHERHFQEALAHHSRVTIPFELARTHLCFGERLRRDRRRARAEEQLRRALEIFEALGAAPWAARTRRELEALGAVTGAPVSAVFAGLTAREVQVALTVGRGATNREAAARLFLSEKTVARHLSAVYAKLGLRSRTELTALVGREAPGFG
jgi:DNA-binding NarL/FixJ family response regulator